MGVIAGHQITTFVNPSNGQTPIDATVVRGNDNTIKSAYNAHDADTTIHLQNGIVSTRPTASTAGQQWLTSDTGAVYLYLDTGSAWVEANYLHQAASGAVTIASGGLRVTTGNVGVGPAQSTSIGVYLDGAILSGSTSQYGFYTDATMSSAATAVGAGMYSKVITAAAAFTMVNAYGVQVAAPTLGAASAITTNSGLRIENQGATGITTAYGIDIAAQSGASSLSVGIRNGGTLIQNDTAYFAVGIQVTAGGVAITAGGLTVSAGTTAVQALTAAGFSIFGSMATTGATAPTLCIQNTTAPSAIPSGGGYLYVEAGALKYRGSTGTTTTIAVA